MVAFLSLLPAFTLYLTLNTVIDLGTSPAAGHLVVLSGINGTMVSEPTAPVQVNANLVDGFSTDFLTVDNDGRNIRLGVRALLLTDDGVYIEATATGVQQVIPQQGAILTGQPNATALPYGASQDGMFSSLASRAAERFLSCS